MSTLAQQAPQMRRIHRRRRAPRGRRNVLSPVKVAASGGESSSSDAADHAVAHESPLSAQKEATWTQSDKVLQQHLNGYNLLTVEEFEKCLRHTNESTANIGLKNNSHINMERYLNEQLSEVLFGRDILTADIDIDSTVTRFSGGYDHVYNESPNLYFNKEDDYVLSEFQLDNLDQLDYCSDEINLVGDFSSLNGTLLPHNISNINTKDLIIRLQETINKFNDSNKNVENDQVQNENCISENFENSSLTSLQDLTLENTSYNELNISKQNNYAACENSELHSSPQTQPVNYSVKKHALNVNNIKPPAKSKFQSNIITRRRALMIREENVNKEKESTTERTKNSISESQENKQNENFTLRPYAYLNPQEIAIAKALFEIGIKDSMLKYIYTPDKIKMWICHVDDCERQFPKLCSLKTHLLQHYGIKPFKCDYEGCSWAFYADVKLKRHKETHLKKKNFVCTIPGCKRSFSTIQNQAYHEKQHSLSNRLSCQITDCNEKFKNKRDLELHLKSHDGSEPSYICSFDGCGKRFYTNNNLMAHRRCHSHSSTEITCSWPGCGKTFDHPCRLKTHMRFHTGTKPYTCTFKGCKWAFSTASKLKRHQMKHTNDRKFTCDIENCKKAFMRLEHLKDHKLRHDVKEKFLQCNLCSSSFSEKKTLYAHIKKHGNKEPVIRRKTVEKTVEKKKTTRQKKEFVCSTVQPLRLTIKRVSKKSSANKTETEKAAGIQNTRRKSARINKNSVIGGLAFSNSENKEDTGNEFVSSALVKPDFQKEPNLPLTEIQNVTHLNSSSLTSQEEIIAVCTPQCLASNQAVQMQNQAEPATSENETLENQAQSTSVQGENIAGNRGSARTALTRDGVLSLKPNRGGSNLNVKVNDIVLDVANIEDGLMLFEDLMPFAGCQDDIGVPPNQILLLNTGIAENEISVQDLD